MGVSTLIFRKVANQLKMIFFNIQSIDLYEKWLIW